MAERVRGESNAHSLEQPSLEELRQRILQDDLDARNELWLRLLPILRLTAACAVYRHGGGIVGTASYSARGVSRQELVNDALHDVFVNLKRYLENVHTSIEGALKSATWGRVIDLIRDHIKIRDHEKSPPVADESGHDMPDPAAGAPTPEERLLEAENEVLTGTLAEMVRDAIDIVATGSSKGTRRMAALRLRFAEGLKVEEVAKRLGVSKRTAEYDLTKGALDIQRVLRKQFGVESREQFFREGPRNGR